MEDKATILDISKSIYNAILSSKNQIVIMVFIIILYYFKKFNPTDFLAIKDFIVSIIPVGIISALYNMVIPITNLLLFIANIGFIILILLLVIYSFYEFKGLFESFIFNYKYYFQGTRKGIFDNLVEKLIIIPININFIIIGICFLFDINKFSLDESSIAKFYNLPYLIMIMIYLTVLMSIFTTKVEAD